ncbi:SAM-dependent methyltransferase [Solemya velum gill symbiont]|uniref:Methylase n=2 Tax=Solemya velum gill symbiont TaxID=2340 RepID=A0A0B0HB05_SOVGS|nr:class I SAM-dependent methyltransferase [Solemya velum gill symbiont]KHF25054.1 methylase [Solemya velum gill symbiont]OOY34896.1 SAM-dependent methyltransferase [Solemya velum gill symbiont]OOY36504.1 SAM-dependent methyltransferase [Solemya velum gill symbiont]OOY47302.1 SAM-dependent methyltransferase [Solemya velum gill symbiont]OOY49398.1 SAM-dependent methyltransferase [Solemya velum gill symbiont]
MVRISESGELPDQSDMELMSAYLPLQQGDLLELGCGTAQTTRDLANRFPGSRWIATEVDQVQHEKNLASNGLANLIFQSGGMQQIDLPNASIDAVIMLKSLHHVSVDQMDSGFQELHRVLRQGGLVYISEPVYAGDFNQILRLFNDEKQVREQAFAAIQRAIESGLFELDREVHFQSLSRYEGFADFEQRVLGVTHSNYDLNDSLLASVKSAFSPHVDVYGIAEFHNPMRVDILRKI